MLDTRVTRLFGTRAPIVQGGMAWVADAHLAAAVSEAGGLGVVACGSAPPDVVRGMIETLRAKTDKPFGINIMLMSEHSPALAQMAIEEKVPAVFTGAGNPGPYIAAWKEAGIIVVPVVASVALAVRMERAGADAVVAEGCEAGGHIGELTTMAMLPQIVDAVSIPVIAAGGIADGRGMAAAFALGAQGVQMGTRFVCCNECTAHENFKNKIIAARDTETLVTGRSTGHPVRALKNKFARAFAEKEAEGASLEELESFGSGALRAAYMGDDKAGSLMAGQVAGMIKSNESAKDIIDSVCEEALSVAKRLCAEAK